MQAQVVADVPVQPVVQQDQLRLQGMQALSSRVVAGMTQVGNRHALADTQSLLQACMADPEQAWRLVRQTERQGPGHGHVKMCGEGAWLPTLPCCRLTKRLAACGSQCLHGQQHPSHLPGMPGVRPAPSAAGAA